MIPAAFAYARPSTVDEALQAIAEGGDDVKIMAGGQSLIPVMRLRLAAPETVVDLTRVAEMRGVRDDGDAIVIGAMTTHHDVMTDPLVLQHAPLIAEATETVADRQVRHRGTFGGALAHADPAGDLPAVALAMAQIHPFDLLLTDVVMPGTDGTAELGDNVAPVGRLGGDDVLASDEERSLCQPAHGSTAVRSAPIRV